MTEVPHTEQGEPPAGCGPLFVVLCLASLLVVATPGLWAFIRSL